MRLDAAGSSVAAQPAGAGVALLAFERPPSAHARRADPKPVAGSPVAQTLRDRHKHTNPKIKR